MNYEPRGYEVQGRHLGWAKSAFETAGYPVQTVVAQPGGVYVIIINMPLGAPDLDFRSMPTKRRTWLRLPSGRIMFWISIVFVVGVVAWVMAGSGIKLPVIALPGAPVAPTVPSIPNVTGLQSAMDGAVNAAKTAMATAVLGVGLFVAFKFRGPLAMVGGALGNMVKGLRHGR